MSINAIINIRKFLQDHDIAYSESGKNISREWIGISCVFCGDTANHLGISPGNTFSCWKCAETGNAIKLIKYIADVSWGKAYEIAEQYIDSSLPQITEKVHKKSKDLLKHITPIALDNVPPLVSKFITKRRFTVHHLLRNRVMFAGHQSEVKFRMVIPVFLDGKIVNYVARDLTDTSNMKYRPCDNEKAIVPIKQTLYGYDDLPSKSVITIVEGMLDQWRMGFGSVAIMGSILTDHQMVLIKRRNPKKVNVLLDADAVDKADKIANKLWFTDIEIIGLPDGDPADLTNEEAREIMREIQ